MEKRFCFILLLLLFACNSVAQHRIDEPLPEALPLHFTEVDSDTEIMQEFTASIPSLVTTEYSVNNIVPIRYFRPKEKEGSLPTVVILHYWGANNLVVERSLAKELARRGMASAVVTLPYHLERTPQGFRSGQLAIQPDISHLISMMQQAVLDVRSVVRALMVTSGVDSTKLMLTGTSLGSIVAANVYALEPEINAAAFIVGGVDLAHILWHSSLVVKQRDALRSKGYTEARVRTELADIEPLNFLGQRSASGKTLVIGGRFDTVVPAVDTEKLIQALPSGQHLWLETGHYGGIFVQRRILNEAANFFESLVSGEDYEAPKKLVAPTLRIAATASTMYPLEIGIGIDFISTPRRDMFGTALVTPRGPRLFIGGRLDKSVSIGVIGAPNKVGVGLLWSTIL